MIACIDEHRGAYGVEPIREVPPIAPSTRHEHAARRTDRRRLPPRAKRDAGLPVEIGRVFDETLGVHGVGEVRHRLRREGVTVARCTVARPMRGRGPAGVVRGGPARTTVSDKAAPCPLDRVGRRFRAPAPNTPWVADLTHVATRSGFVCVAFVVAAYARRSVGRRVSRTAHAGFVPDALERALRDRRPVEGRLVHRSGRGRRYVCIRCSERLAEAGIEPSAGGVGDSYDDALAETIDGLCKAEVIHRRGPWRSGAAVECAPLAWVDRFNNPRPLEPIGHGPPAEAEANHYAALDEVPLAA